MPPTKANQLQSQFSWFCFSLLFAPLSPRISAHYSKLIEADCEMYSKRKERIWQIYIVVIVCKTLA